MEKKHAQLSPVFNVYIHSSVLKCANKKNLISQQKYGHQK